MLSRRTLLRTAVLGSAAPFVNKGSFQLFASTATAYSARTIDLVQRSTIIDMLGLITLDWNRLNLWHKTPGSFTAQDWNKLRQSGITAFHPAVDMGATDPYATNWRLMGDWNAFLQRYPNYFVRVSSASDLELAKSSGRIAIILGFQNSDHFRSVEDVYSFQALGQRVSQLTYNTRNQIGFGCTAAHDEGLSEFGHSIVAAMNKAGVAIDVSHTGERSSMDAFEASSRPVLITHSNCRALVQHHPRCKSDEVIRAMAKNGGVMGITGIRSFVRGGEAATIEDVVDHFDHVAKLVGVEHVGIGSDTDLDGRDHTKRLSLDIEGLNHPRRVFDLTEHFIRRNYSDSDIELILGGNFRRVLKTIWTI